MKRLTNSRAFLPSLVIVLSLVAILSPIFCLHLGLADSLALAGVVLVLGVASVQQIDATVLKRIAVDTAETAHKIRMDALLEKNVSDFFAVSTGDQKCYTCVFPVEFNHKPLPLINAGDFYALHVLKERLGPERLRLHLFLRGEEAQLAAGNAILVCAPDANPSTNTIFGPHKMPCWIKTDGRGVKYIEVSEPNHKSIEVYSPCERHYAEARTLAPAALYGAYTNQENYMDLGILARVSVGSSRYVLIAGIHQQGTWIVAAYLDKLLQTDRNSDPRVSMFFEPHDLAVILTGTFQASRFGHSGVDIYPDCRWQKKQGQWQRVGQ